MIDVTEFPWNYSLISLLFHCLQVLRKVILMALGSRPPLPCPPRPLSGTHRRSMNFSPGRCIFASMQYPRRNSGNSMNPLPSEPQAPVSEGLVSVPKKHPQENLHLAPQVRVETDAMLEIEENPQQNLHIPPQKSIDETARFKRSDFPNEKAMIPTVGGLVTCKGGETSRKMRKKPTRIAIPQPCLPDFIFNEGGSVSDEKQPLVEGEGFYLASKRGERNIIEDDYRLITSIHGDSKQAFFGVFDGHGGRAAVDYVVDNLGKNIITALTETERGERQFKEAIRRGYLATDQGFISKDVASGVCVATVILKDGELNVAHLGDCRVVLSRKGVAEALTTDHRVEREDERLRIERTGGFVSCHNGVWRVNGSLAVSRAIGDAHLKEWIISEPETKSIRLKSDCDFLIVASDGLWDKVANQEAVDVVMKNKNSIESCKQLVELSLSRGCKDDITVLVVYLANFIHNA